MTADLAGVWVGLPVQVREAILADSEHERHGQSVDRWAASHGVRLPEAQRDRFVKFLDDWTRQ